jgi:hypothetical protein
MRIAARAKIWGEPKSGISLGDPHFNFNILSKLKIKHDEAENNITKTS